MTGVVLYASATARDDAIRAYDACYPVIAMRTDWPLATLDRKLTAAASQAGVALA